jgi:AraC family transcriptional activator of pobA
MYTEAKVIPKYPFEPESGIGNKLFRINRNYCVVNYTKSDFLVPHRKDYYFFAFVKMGNSRHWIDTIPYVLQPNTFYFTVPHQVHLKEMAEPMSGITFSFHRDFLALNDSNFLKSLPLIRNPDNGHELRLSSTDLLFVEDILEKIYAEYQSRHDWQQNMLLAYVKVLLIYLSRLYTEQISNTAQAPDKLVLKKYLANIEASYTSLHEVAEYAALMNISAGHLSELIKEQSGKPAIAHIHERLLVEAKRLLFHSDLAVKEIAFELGFEDASYFNRFFKRLSQQTPAQYRSTIREMYH